MEYFDTTTGALVDDREHGLAIEARLANRHTLYPVSGVAAKIVRAGREQLGLENTDLAPLVDTVERPEAQETPAQAKKAYEAEQKALAKEKAAEALSEQPDSLRESDQAVPANPNDGPEVDVKARSSKGGSAKSTGKKVGAGGGRATKRSSSKGKSGAKK